MRHCIVMCEKALEIDTDNAKALYRMAQVMKRLLNALFSAQVNRYTALKRPIRSAWGSLLLGPGTAEELL